MGPSLVWEVREVGWWLDAAAADLAHGRGRVESVAAFGAWSEPACSDLAFSLEGVRRGLESEYRPEGANRNVVVLLDDWPSAPGTIALTLTAFDTRTGVILDADIELNGEAFALTVVEDIDRCSAEPAVDLRNTLTHEVGHLIGLDHPPARPRFADTTMFASAAPCEITKRTLAADDVAGLCAIYPAGGATRPCFPPDQPSFVVVDEDAGYGRGCRAGGAPAMLPAAGMSLLLGWIRRRRGAG